MHLAATDQLYIYYYDQSYIYYVEIKYYCRTYTVVCAVLERIDIRESVWPVDEGLIFLQ